jgi:hypothetical protein
VLASLCALLLHAFASTMRVLGRVSSQLAAVMGSFYDVYIALPVKLETWVKSRNDWEHTEDDDDEIEERDTDGTGKRVAGGSLA